MPKEEPVEPTTADTTEYTVQDALAAIRDNAIEAPEDEKDEAEEEDAGEKPSEEAESEEKLTPLDDAASQTEEDPKSELEAILKDKEVPQEVKERLLKYEKGVEKIVTRAKEAEEKAVGWEKVLTDPRHSADAIADLVKQLSGVTGLSAEQILSKALPQPVQAPKPELDPKNLPNYLDHGYQSPKEMELAIEAAELRKTMNQQAEQFNKFLKEQEELKVQQAKAKQTEDWLTGNAPKIIAEIERQFDGLKLTKEQVRQGLNGNVPGTLSEAVATVKARHVDLFYNHAKRTAAPPPKKKELISGGSPKGKHLVTPSDPFGTSLSNMTELVKAIRHNNSE